MKSVESVLTIPIRMRVFIIRTLAGEVRFELTTHGLTVRCANHYATLPDMVRAVGLEPTRRKHENLNLACLPIPSRPHNSGNHRPTPTFVVFKGFIW